MSDDTTIVKNRGTYPEHPRDGALVFSENGLLFFGGQTYRRVGAADGLLPETNGSLEDRVTALEDRIAVLETAEPAPSEPEVDVENVPRPRFARGDRVVYIAPPVFGGHPGYESAARPDGTFGTVREDSHGEAGVYAHWESESQPTMTSVEYVQPAPPTKYAIGDVVEIGQSIYSSVAPGAWGIVRGVSATPDGGRVYSVKMPYRSFLFNENEIRGKVS